MEMDACTVSASKFGIDRGIVFEADTTHHLAPQFNYTVHLGRGEGGEVKNLIQMWSVFVKGNIQTDII